MIKATKIRIIGIIKFIFRMNIIVNVSKNVPLEKLVGTKK